MSQRPELLIPKIGVVTDIRMDTPDVKTFRVVTPEGGRKLLNTALGNAPCSRFQESERRVFHHLLADKRGVYGIFH